MEVYNPQEDRHLWISIKWFTILCQYLVAIKHFNF